MYKRCKNFGKKVFNGVKRNFNKVMTGAAALGTSLYAKAACAEPTLTVPDVDTTILYDAAGKAYAAVAIVIAIVIGIRIFKRV